MKNILQVKNLFYKYDKKLVLDDVSFNIRASSFFVLLGLNGAGKSTIFSLLTRLLNIQSGEITINNHPISKYNLALKDIGIVFQEPTLDLDLTVRQNLYYYGALKGLGFKATIDSIKQEIINLGLQEKLDTKTSQLNGGHRRRVEILRALINSPKILLLDEPTVGLDLKSRFDILNYLRDLVNQKKLSVLWITHLFDEVNDNDDLAIIKDGKIIEKGVVKDIINKYQKENLTKTFESILGLKND